jgi:hypothetical protein
VLKVIIVLLARHRGSFNWEHVVVGFNFNEIVDEAGEILDYDGNISCISVVVIYWSYIKI